MKNAKAPLYDQWYFHEGEGQVVLLLHGLFGNLKLWSTTAEALRRNYRVLVPRLPLSEFSHDGTDMPYLVGVLHDFIVWNNLEEVILVGHGRGGELALSYTCAYPAGVCRLVVSGTSGFPVDTYLIDSAKEEIDYDLVEEKVHSAFLQPGAASKKLMTGAFTTLEEVQSAGSISEAVDKNRIALVLNRIDHPVLLLWGMDDKVTPPDIAMHFHDFLQNSVVKFIEQCGHVPMLDQPNAYNQHLLDFMAG